MAKVKSRYGCSAYFLEPNNSLKAYNHIKELIGELNPDIQVQLITEKVMGDADIVYFKIR